MNSRTVNAITPNLIREISRQLADNLPVRIKLPHNGRLHIDRQLPFLCIHRQQSENDLGTDHLILGQGSYLRTTADDDIKEALSSLVEQIIHVQGNAFGSFIIVELWSEPNSGNDKNIPAFHLVVPKKHMANETVKSLENSLSKIKLRKNKAHFKTSYQNSTSPPGLAPLLDHEQLKKQNCLYLGIGVNPVYLDAENNRLLPYALHHIRHTMTVALKKAFYAFSHNNTRYQPAHYHELGPNAITEAVWQVDRKLAEISEQFDLLLHVTPVNASEAWQAFEQNRYKKAPLFHYRPRNVDPALLKRELYQVPLEEIEDPTLLTLFFAKRDELDRELTLLHDRNTPRFLHGSIQIFGKPDSRLLETAESILNQPDQPAKESTLIDPQQFAQRAREQIDHYREEDPTLAARVEVRDDITGILVSHGNFLVGSDARVSPQRLEATLSHEIGTHALTYHNGKQQPFHQLYAGMAGYEELQEGIAVLSEYLCGGLDLPRLKMLAGRVIAVNSIISGADFVESFNLLHDQYNFKPLTAFNIVMRVYRGGGYTKDMVYLRGPNLNCI